ncbi:MAG: hypothetical protein J5789_00540 [Oscillospiraceae bacterium]|nr:hypothetical protein [Oscillospiraceae bacterium]
MLFRKDIEKTCACCVRSGQSGGENLICPKKGFVSPEGHCWRFRYDPLKRTPKRSLAKDFSQFTEEDFSL